jgi:AraC family transcriptional regulator
MTEDCQAINLLDIVPETWVMDQITLSSGDLVIQHHLESSGEIAVPALTHHLLCVHIGKQTGSRQITRLGHQEYDGVMPTGAFWLATANNTAAEWIWEMTDESIMFQIEPGYFQAIAAENDCIAPEQLELKPILFDRNPQIEHIARLYRAEMQQKGVGRRLYSESLGNLFILELLRNYCQNAPKLLAVQGGLGRKRLQCVLDYIDAHLAENIGLQDMAAIAGLSQHYFATLFKQSTGISPYAYVVKQRVERAKQQLQRSTLSISDVALVCGFADQSHLTKHFRNLYGMTPMQFRKS